MKTPRWLSILTILFSLSFIVPGLFLIFSPSENIVSIYSSFGIDTTSDPSAVQALVSVFIGLTVRNIAIAIVMGVSSFRDLRVVLTLWALRLIVEVADLFIALFTNPQPGTVLAPIIAFTVVELIVLGLGFRQIQQQGAAK